MSPLWRDEVRILLTPRRLCYLRRARGLRPRIVERRAAAFGDGQAGPTGALERESVLAALADLLGQAGGAPADATVVLSGHFVRHALLPPSPLLAGAADYVMLARHSFAQVHGPEAEGWNLRVSDTRDAEPRIASAMDEALVGGLRETLLAARLRPRSLQPLLMSVFNAARARIGNAPCALLVVEPGWVQLAQLERGWRRLRGQRIGADWRTDVARFVARERLLDDRAGAEEPLFVAAPLLDSEAGVLREIDGCRIEPLATEWAQFAGPLAPAAAQAA